MRRGAFLALALIASFPRWVRNDRRAVVEGMHARDPLFTPRATAVARYALIGLIGAAVAIPMFFMGWVRTAYHTGEQALIEQPVWFDHRHHTAGFEIDCRYCHDLVERSSFAGIPATEVCLPCHSQVWLASPYFEPVRRSIETGQPIPWRRVHQLPDHTYFNHAIHVNKGVGCETCHGRVDQMPLVRQVVPLTMRWCLDCHREPQPYLRPVEAMTTMGWTPAVPQRELGRALALQYDVRRLTNCTACHR